MVLGGSLRLSIGIDNEILGFSQSDNICFRALARVPKLPFTFETDEGVCNFLIHPVGTFMIYTIQFRYRIYTGSQSKKSVSSGHKNSPICTAEFTNSAQEIGARAPGRRAGDPQQQCLTGAAGRVPSDWASDAAVMAPSPVGMFRRCERWEVCWEIAKVYGNIME